MWKHHCVASVGLVFVWHTVIGMDACDLFTQRVLAMVIIPLIIRVCRCGGWCPVLRFSALVEDLTHSQNR